ncbi:carboxypeptidase-like regulatory domain-containing protein [Clostridium thermarum]|uniref:carboxypeptidase-like regulatory domain-containing protein n=1 Tax=Clostridium thermarum TaxID=1716543 RepID=UPI0013CF6B5E|nr:carboxypeptidase-like regulatory domain-containing protein [Clostridium thermarum]
MKKLIKGLSKLLIFTMVLSLISLNIGEEVRVSAKSDSNNGDWDAQYVQKRYPETNEAELTVRVGDIDNMGYGFGDIDPFSGKETSTHGYPFVPEESDHKGTDKVMVISGFRSESGYNEGNGLTDGYTGQTYKKSYTITKNGKKQTFYYNTTVEPIKLTYDLKDINVKDAQLQLFVDDIQPTKYKKINNIWVNDGRGGFSQKSYNKYEVTMWVEGKDKQAVRVSAFEDVINNLDQHGPIGKLITLNFPTEYLDLVKQGGGGLYIKIDDTDVKTTSTAGNSIYNTGDGYAIDFAKLLVNVNPENRTYHGTVKGRVYEAEYKDNTLILNYNKPVSDAKISFSGVNGIVTSDANGNYICSEVPAGQVIVKATKDGYAEASYAIGTLIAKQELIYDIGLIKTDTPLRPIITLDNYMPTNEAVTVTVHYPGTVTRKVHRIDGGPWLDYSGPFKVDYNCLIEAKSIREIKTSSTITEQYESEIAEYRVTNIDKTIPPKPVLTPDTTQPVNRDIKVTITYPQGQIVKEAQVKLGNGNWVKYLEGSIPSNVIVTDNMVVYAKYKNQYGNWSEIASLDINNIDKILPTATLSYETVDGASYNPVNWTNKNIKAILSNFDSQDVTVTIKNSPVVPQTITDLSGKKVSYIFDVPNGTEATPSITFVLRDLAGNETEIVASAKIDKIKPSAAVTMKTTDGALYDPSEWTNKNIVFVFSDFDSQDTTVLLAGVDSGKFITDNNGGNRNVRYTTEYGNVDNTYTLDFMLTDKAGNTVPISRTVKVDSIAPTVTITTAVNPTDKKIKVVTATASEQVTFTSPSKTDIPVLSIDHQSSKAEEVNFQFYDKAGNTGEGSTKVDMLHRER